MSEQCAEVDENAVLEVVRSKAITTFFQPVVSISTKSIIGFEAFSRGGGEACAIDASHLFHDSLNPETKVEVDRLCRERALVQFKSIHDQHKGMLLFVNINPDIFQHVGDASTFLATQVKDIGVAPENVVLECRLNNPYMDSVAQYVRQYGEMGYKACLDNSCVDDAFSHALSVVGPNFVKVGREFFGEEDRKEYSAKALNNLINVAKRLGVTVIGQGVETEDESVRLLSAGIHLQQGYYYTKDYTKNDGSESSGDPAKTFIQKIVDTGEKYKLVKREMVRRRKGRFNAAFSTVASLVSKFANISEDRFEDACRTLVHNTDGVISMFLLNNVGVQITDRMIGRGMASTVNSPTILGMQKGVDHSVQDYMMYLDMGYEKYVTQPFVSPFSGEDACIISKSFFNVDGTRYVACIEMAYPA